LNIENHIGSPGYYLLEIKFRNQAGSAPDSFLKTSSSLPALYSIRVFVDNEKFVETAVDISFGYSTGSISSITVNGSRIVTSTPIPYDSTNKGYFGNLFFELWLYDDASKTFKYNERYVGLWFSFS
jgi:hypothetical protein